MKVRVSISIVSHASSSSSSSTTTSALYDDEDDDVCCCGEWRDYRMRCVWRMEGGGARHAGFSGKEMVRTNG
jgi:hypothetical protein